MAWSRNKLFQHTAAGRFRDADLTDSMGIALIDYDMGNLGSVAKALEFLGAKCDVVENAAELERFDACILPGVGSFGDGMDLPAFCHAQERADVP